MIQYIQTYFTTASFFSDEVRVYNVTDCVCGHVWSDVMQGEFCQVR